MVEHNLAKVGVASSNLVSRSRYPGPGRLAGAFDFQGFRESRFTGVAPLFRDNGIFINGVIMRRLSIQQTRHHPGNIIREPDAVQWLSGRVVMQRPAKPLTSVRFRAQPPHIFSSGTFCPGGGIGRRKGLKIPR